MAVFAPLFAGNQKDCPQQVRIAENRQAGQKKPGKYAAFSVPLAGKGISSFSPEKPVPAEGGGIGFTLAPAGLPDGIA